MATEETLAQADLVPKADSGITTNGSVLEPWREKAKVNGGSIVHPSDTTDAWVQELMSWHFNQSKGSPFWLDKLKTLDFNPLTDIKTLSDLARFPDVSAELRHTPVDKLVPRGLMGQGAPEIFESGGTTGAVKRIVDFSAFGLDAKAASASYDEHDFPETGDWLYVGPTGPHVMGHVFTCIAQLRKASLFRVDFDPRFVKRALRAQRFEVAADYVDHILAQAQQVLCDQRVAVCVFTPPVLTAAVQRTSMLRLLERVPAITWGGTSITQETLRMLEEEFLPDTTIAGMYGNTLMGCMVQRPRRAEDPVRCVYPSGYPRSSVSVTQFADPLQPAAYATRGRVLVHRLTLDMFLPNVLERDSAIRLPGSDGHDELGDVRSCSYQELQAGPRPAEGVSAPGAYSGGAYGDGAYGGAYGGGAYGDGAYGGGAYGDGAYGGGAYGGGAYGDGAYGGGAYGGAYGGGAYGGGAAGPFTEGVY